MVLIRELCKVFILENVDLCGLYCRILVFCFVRVFLEYFINVRFLVLDAKVVMFEGIFYYSDIGQVQFGI